jgi:hypothetical protein
VVRDLDLVGLERCALEADFFRVAGFFRDHGLGISQQVVSGGGDIRHRWMFGAAGRVRPAALPVGRFPIPVILVGYPGCGTGALEFVEQLSNVPQPALDTRQNMVSPHFVAA